MTDIINIDGSNYTLDNKEVVICNLLDKLKADLCNGSIKAVAIIHITDYFEANGQVIIGDGIKHYPEIIAQLEIAKHKLLRGIN